VDDPRNATTFEQLRSHPQVLRVEQALSLFDDRVFHRVVYVAGSGEHKVAAVADGEHAYPARALLDFVEGA
jgi:hypothetical protein